MSEIIDWAKWVLVAAPMMGSLSRSAAKKRYDNSLMEAHASAMESADKKDWVAVNGAINGVVQLLWRLTDQDPDKWLPAPSFPERSDDGKHFSRPPKMVGVADKLAAIVERGEWLFHGMDAVNLEHMKGALSDKKTDHRSHALVSGLLVLFSIHRRIPNASS